MSGRASTIALCAVCAAVQACYTSWNLGAAYPTGRPQSHAGGDIAMDVGLVFDYRRVVRIAYARSFQMFGGATFTAQHGREQRYQ